MPSTINKHKHTCKSPRCGGCLKDYDRGVTHNTAPRLSGLMGYNRNGVAITSDQMFDFEAGELGRDDIIQLFQYLVDIGIVWELQGFYGRTAKTLLDAGLIEGGARCQKN